jgi:hypothetical protein
LLNELEALQLAPKNNGHVFNFGEMPVAIKFFQKGKTVGKVALAALANWIILNCQIISVGVCYGVFLQLSFPLGKLAFLT